MPDQFFTQEHNETYFGLFNQPSEPASLSKRFVTLLHNQTLIRGMPHTRPGRRRLNGVLAGDGARTVYGMAIWRTTIDELVIACGSKLQTMPTAGGELTTMTTSYPTGYRASPVGARTNFAQLGSRLFIVNGIDDNIKYNGTNLTRMGVVAPTSLTTPSKTAGALTGSWKYTATHVSSTLNGSVESEPTAVLSVSYTNERGTFSAPTVPSSDPQIDRWNLYRTTAGGSIYYRINTTPVTLATTIVDNIADSVLTNGTQRNNLLTNNPPPGIFSKLISHQGRLVGVTTAEPNTLYWSDLGIDISGIYPKPESWPPVNRLVFGENGGTAITGLVSFFDWLVVFQNFGTWSIRGDMSSDERLIEPLLVAPDNRGIGLSDQGNIGHGENKTIFAAKDGLYQILKDTSQLSGGLAITHISRNIDDLYQTIDFSAGGVSVYDRDARRWMFWGKGKANSGVS